MLIKKTNNTFPNPKTTIIHVSINNTHTTNSHVSFDYLTFIILKPKLATYLVISLTIGLTITA
ncbi:hypothetical protein KS4_12940 [Poriferisphaera corsica]|uniref:Uncharacterized protein n=1 Tax=Poriferisphaera corsica TaxID=2528020 RepID=A0A517YSN8_9BACT|nr:hypothetical protein [Poriferisphaera corsica]QDU33249.1 hypothetical protein KS4_12940 [Poriferisphaera corsica]